MNTYNYQITDEENRLWDSEKILHGGTATSSYQIEGAVKGEGKGEHIWDVYTKEPGHVFEGHTGETACDHYHRYPEDVKMM